MHPPIVIPALNPDERLRELVRDLRCETNAPIVIVDDGSIPECREVFQALEREFRCNVLHHPHNQGKGAALKTAVRHILDNYPDCTGCVTADADGQHRGGDILRVAQALEKHPGSLVLGARDFSGPQVPCRSRWGNRITKVVFRLSTGVSCADTQTGLRGLPMEYLPLFAEIPGARFEYEMNTLVEAAREKIPFLSVPIETVYDDNHTSHFRTVVDAVRVYGGVLRFLTSSLVSAAVDLGLFRLLTRLIFGQAHTGIIIATICARAVSGLVNFLINRGWVFRSSGRPAAQAGKYAVLFFSQMAASALLTALLSKLPVPLMLVKIIVDFLLFLISYHIQKRWVFTGSRLVKRRAVGR